MTVTHTSASSGQTNSFGTSGIPSLSRFFWRQIRTGVSYGSAFTSARLTIGPISHQTPSVDDNGDGLANNKTMTLANTWFLGTSGMDLQRAFVGVVGGVVITNCYDGGTTGMNANGLDVGSQSKPVMVDIDGDGDLDMFIAGAGNSLWFYRNDGSPTAARWALPQTNFGGIQFEWGSVPAFCDIDGDNDLDLFVATPSGSLNFYENIGTCTSPVWNAPTTNYQNLAELGRESPTFCDIDADGDYDLFWGTSAGTITYIENTGTATAPSWGAPISNYANIAIAAGVTTVATADIDQDGDSDLFIGQSDGQVTFCENSGTAAQPAWKSPVTYFNAIDIGDYSFPVLADIDGDGDIDLIVGDGDGGINLWRNNAPHLRVAPVSATLAVGASQNLGVIPATDVTWSFVTNRSSASLDTITGAYRAGSHAPAIDVIEAVDSNGFRGRAYVNVIRAEDASAAGRAIIIAGGKSLDDPVWVATDYMANSAFKALLYKGFAKDNIQYHSFQPNQDVDGNGMNDDIDAWTDLSNVRTTFTNLVGNANKLFIYLTDHGSDSSGEGYFRLNAGENLAATNLAVWLDQIQNTYTTEVTVVMDFCYSGSFVDELAYTGAAKRIVISSCAADELTYFIAGGIVSFSEVFFSSVIQGFDLNQAFLNANGAMSTYQHGQLDDDGNGFYSNTTDGLIAASNRLGASFVVGRDVPQIGAVSPSQSITSGTTVRVFATDVSSVYDIERVWCSVVPPTHSPNTNAGVPIVDIPQVELAYNPITLLYENDVEGLVQPGTYALIFQAEDIWGGVSLPRVSQVTQAGYKDKMLVVAGGPTNDARWPDISYLADSAYVTARMRAFTTNTIFFLSPEGSHDANRDDTNDVNALVSLDQVANAITNWAQDASRLTVYLVGCTSNAQLRLNGTETLEATQLDAWLDRLQSTNIAVNLLMEFDGSGSYLPLLIPPAGQERIIIASASPGQTVEWGYGGCVSFSQNFLSYVSQGASIGDAYRKAKTAIRNSSGRLRQTAQMDDNGDGKPDQKNIDGVLAKKRYWGPAFVTGTD